MKTFTQFLLQLLEDRTGEYSANLALSDNKPKKSPFTILDSKGFQKFFEPYDQGSAKGQASKFFRVKDPSVIEGDMAGFIKVLAVINTSDAGLILVKSENGKSVPLEPSEKMNPTKIMTLVKNKRNYFVQNTNVK